MSPQTDAPDRTAAGRPLGCPGLEVTVTEGVGSIVLDRPETRNAPSPQMAEALLEATGAFERDPAVRCVVISGRGGHFLAGADVKGFHAALTTDRAAHVAAMERRALNGNLAIHRLRRMEKPVVASVQGGVAGFGLGLMLAADLVIAADDMLISLAYRHVGLSPDGGVTHFLPRLIGERRALSLVLLGERCDAARALEWGMVNRVVPKEELAIETAKLLATLASGPAAAMGRAKTLVRTSLETSWDQQAAREAHALALCVAEPDHLEGVSAFIEKRPAKFG